MFEGAAAELGTHRHGGAGQDSRRVRQAQDGLARADAARRRPCSMSARSRPSSPTSSCTSRGIDGAPACARCALAASSRSLRRRALRLALAHWRPAALWPGRRAVCARSRPRTRFAALKAQVRAADVRAAPRRQSAVAGQDRAGQAPVRGQGALVDRHHRLRLLPRSQARPSPTASHAARASPASALVRHTPSLWNVAFSPLLFWDGRAASLEEQVRFPVEHPDEMGATLDNAVQRFSRHESYERDFAEAFPDDPEISARNIATRAGRLRAHAGLAADALRPMGRRRCRRAVASRRSAACRSSPARAAASAATPASPSPTTTSTTSACRAQTRAAARRSTCAAADHAFKTPTLRELAWTAPYMHDGSLGHAGRRGAPLREGRRAAADAQQGPAAQPQADGSGAGRSRRLPADPSPATAPPQPSTEAWVGAGQPPRTAAAQGHHRRQPGQQAVRAGARARQAPGRRSPCSTTTPAPTTCASSIPGSISTPARRSPSESVTIRFPVSRHLRGLLRHPPLHAADHRRGALMQAAPSSFPQAQRCAESSRKDGACIWIPLTALPRSRDDGRTPRRISPRVRPGGTAAGATGHARCLVGNRQSVARLQETLCGPPRRALELSGLRPGAALRHPRRRFAVPVHSWFRAARPLPERRAVAP